MLDDMISKGRRKMLGAGLTSLAGMLAGALAPSAQAAAFTDADILNFALNLEYLEANFYYLAAFGTTIDVATAASTAAGAPLIKLTGTVGTAGTVSGGSQVPFSTIEVSSYAIETAIEEGKHVQTLLTALGSSARRSTGHQSGHVFPDAGHRGKYSQRFGVQPYASDENFLVGAYVFEDVGVTAYHGAAQYLTVKANLQTRRNPRRGGLPCGTHPHDDQLLGPYRRNHRRVHQSDFYPPRNPFAGWLAWCGAWPIRRKPRRLRFGHFLRNPGSQRHHGDPHHGRRPGQ